MKLRFIDTNIFIEVFARKGERSDKCLKLLEEGKGLWTTSLVLAEVEWVLRAGYELSKREIHRCLRAILALPGLKIEKREMLVEAVEWYGKLPADWVDCVNAVWAAGKRIDKVVSYDKHYERFGFLKRTEP